MKLWQVILGSFLCMGWSMFLFMFVAFAGGGAANGRELSRPAQILLDLSLLLLPGCSLLGGVIVLWQYGHGADSGAFWWYALPLPFFAFYLIWFSWLVHGPHR